MISWHTDLINFLMTWNLTGLNKLSSPARKIMSNWASSWRHSDMKISTSCHFHQASLSIYTEMRMSFSPSALFSKHSHRGWNLKHTWWRLWISSLAQGKTRWQSRKAAVLCCVMPDRAECVPVSPLSVFFSSCSSSGDIICSHSLPLPSDSLISAEIRTPFSWNWTECSTFQTPPPHPPYHFPPYR